MSSVPAVAERAGWQTRRVRRLPQIAALYVGAICLAAISFGSVMAFRRRQFPPASQAVG